MELPVFYAKGLSPEAASYTMDEPTSKHCVQVLRRENGQQVLLANGIGQKFTAVITDDNRKRCTVQIQQQETVPAPTPQLHIAIAFTKNASRMEWFLEKATEIGIQSIIPLITHRTEKEKFKTERLENILVSAMLQSQQYYLPQLAAPTAFEQLVQQHQAVQRFIAHCLPDQKTPLQEVMLPGKDTLLLIGPEGDFTPEEVVAALAKGFQPVSLGNTRLRTETAGMVGAVLMKMS
ncbi:16S rRNA (uracil(1498)-N(3))-methyltransferase [Chitinophaga agrisoli]|uniref:Ribosomal RNA small subunit methyltransferase E n=1 Tax=Chitinophaga agrisoli TaxID=2607653 RepID=A0A5B2VQ68_9BACT|nr:RsmE family RNA methyltransferase [Chitinophaga agrisoli]KAA2240818.1 16S rRNA (uracil(1498)-N(3))-methyltransferase [Chitinophaga agrisoli]